MNSPIAILHYTGPPVVGGVESMIAAQARVLTRLGYPVRLIVGRGESVIDGVDLRILPRLASAHPDVLDVKAELDARRVTPSFTALRDLLMADLRPALAGCEVAILHNISTLHKNLPLTAALHALHAEGAFRAIAWCHDLAWTNEQYRAEMHDGFPWDLLRQPWPGAANVTVSEPRRTEMAALLGLPPESVTIIPPGVDVEDFLALTDQIIRLVETFDLLSADGLLLLPARLTRRKNISLALRVLAELRRQSHRDFRLIVTGPPGPHNPTNAAYLDELRTLQHDLSLESSAHFIYTGGPDGAPFIPDDADVAALYRLADALLFPSLQEGFGIPLLEAGLAGLPVFCADIPPFRATGGADVTFFDPLSDAPGEIAARILQMLDAFPPYRLRVRVRQSFRWEVLICERLVPLLEGS